MYVLQFDLDKIDVNEVNNLLQGVKTLIPNQTILAIPSCTSWHNFNLTELYEIYKLLGQYIREQEEANL